MTRWLLTTLVLACFGTLAETGRAQEVFGPDGFPVAPELIPMPRDRGFLYDVDSPLDLDIRETLERSWVRLEYLNWDVTRPGNVFLGAPLQTFDRNGNFPPGITPINPGTDAFPVQDTFGTRGNVYGYVPNLGDLSFRQNNGIRGTIGIPFQPFTFEGSAWYLAKNDEHIVAGPQVLGGDTLIPVISLLSNGVRSDGTMVPFDSSYDAVVKVNMFGADTNLVLNPIQPGNTIQVSPVIGFKYLQYKNSLSITGVDVTSGLSPLLSSEATNNNFGPQFGLRFSYDNKWFSLSADPKVMLGINRHIDNVHSSQLFTSTELDRTVQEEDTAFAPIFDLGLTGRVHLSTHLSVFVSYNLMAIGNQSTSWNNIYYNAPPDPANDPSAIGLNVDKKAIVVQGLTVGGELRFR